MVKNRWLTDNLRIILIVAVLSSLFLFIQPEPVGAAPVSVAAYSAGDGYSRAIWGANWKAQTFLTPAVTAYAPSSARVKLYKVGSPGTLTVSIRATDGSGYPTGADLAVGTTDANAFSASSAGTWYEITFTSTQTLAIGTTYALVLRAASGTADDEVEWRTNEDTPGYTGGNLFGSGSSGSGWTSWSGRDTMFEVWGNASAGGYPDAVYTNLTAQVGTFTTSLNASTGRRATFVIGSTGTSQVDYSTNGTSDQVVFLTAVNAAPSTGADIVFRTGSYSFNGPLIINRDNISIIGESGSKVTLADASNSNMIEVTGTAGDHVLNFELSGGEWDGNKAGNIGAGDYRIVSSTYVDGLSIYDTILRNADNYAVYNVGSTTGASVSNVKSYSSDGLAYDLDMGVFNSLIDDAYIAVYRTSLYNSRLTDIRHGGVYLSSNQTAQGNYFSVKVGATASAVNIEYPLTGLVIQDVRVVGNTIVGTGGSFNGLTSGPNDNNITVQDVIFSSNTIRDCVSAIGIGAQADKTGVVIRRFIIDDNNIQNSTTWDISITRNNQGIIPTDIKITSSNRYSFSKTYLQASRLTIEPQLEYEYVREIPISSTTWTNAVTGTGNVSGIDSIILNTNATNSSTAYAYFRTYFSTYTYPANYDKRYILELEGARLYDVANSLFYFKLDDDATVNNPDSKSIGIVVGNFTVSSNVYDTLLHTSSLGVSYTDGSTSSVRIIHVPGVADFFYFDEVYVGLVTTIPSGTMANGELISIGLTNGASDAEARFYGLLVRIRKEK